MKKQFTLVHLFAGAGGISEGFHQGYYNKRGDKLIIFYGKPKEYLLSDKLKKLFK